MNQFKIGDVVIWDHNLCDPEDLREWSKRFGSAFIVLEDDNYSSPLVNPLTPQGYKHRTAPPWRLFGLKKDPLRTAVYRRRNPQ